MILKSTIENGETPALQRLPGRFWKLSLSSFIRVPFPRASCQSGSDRDCIRMLCPESYESGHLPDILPEKIILDVALVRMVAGEFCPGIPYRTESAAVTASGASYGLFLFFHYMASFPGSFFRFSIWHLTKMWKLPSRYVCPFSSISSMAFFCCRYHSSWDTFSLLHTRRVTMDVG